MRLANTIISFTLLAFAGFYAVLIANLPTRDLPNTLGAAFVPWVLAGMLTLLSIILLVSSILSKKDDTPVSIPSRDLIGITGLLILIALYVKFLNYLGFVLSSIMFLAILTWFAGSRKPLGIAIFSITASITIYLLFYKFFNVQLPAGIFS